MRSPCQRRFLAEKIQGKKNNTSKSASQLSQGEFC